MIPATLNPRLLALYGNEMPKHHVREWMHSYHVRRRRVATQELEEVP